MSSPVDPTEIEGIVGHRRMSMVHLGRAVNDEEMVYILHSERCRSDLDDLRECIYSKALDRGIDLNQWEDCFDKPVVLEISKGGQVQPDRDYAPFGDSRS